jgi:hypothetical protein
MIASLGSRRVGTGRPACHTGFTAQRATTPCGAHRPSTEEPAAPRPQSHPRDFRRTPDSANLVPEAAVLPSPARATAAARAFAAGNGYLAGLIVDRLA